jgi:hypothetical protein
MFATMAGGQEIFVGSCVLVLLFMLYMMAFRTDDFIRLHKADEERKQRQAARLGGAAKGAVMLFKLLKRR